MAGLGSELLFITVESFTKSSPKIMTGPLVNVFWQG